MRGSAGVMAVVLAETAAGASALLFLSPLWGEVRRGFYKVTGTVLLGLAGAAWWSGTQARIPGDVAGRWSVWLTAAMALLTLAWLLLLFLRHPGAARILGIASVPLGAVLLVALAGTARASATLAIFQLVAGAAFLGAVLDGLLLGHWYLTDRKLTRAPINRLSTALIGAVVLETAAVVAGGFGGVESSKGINPLLTAGALAPWIALGMVGTTALIAVLTRATLRGAGASAVQAATGFFYLAVITASTAEVALKVRFLPG